MSSESTPRSVTVDGERLRALRLACEERFRRVAFDDRAQVEAGRMDELRYWRLYWSLQHDQYRYWRQGAMPRETYAVWLRQRHRDWLANEPLVSQSYREGWLEARDWLRAPDFVTFMERVFSGEIDLVVSPRDGPIPSAA